MGEIIRGLHPTVTNRVLAKALNQLGRSGSSGTQAVSQPTTSQQPVIVINNGNSGHSHNGQVVMSHYNSPLNGFTSLNGLFAANNYPGHPNFNYGMPMTTGNMTQQLYAQQAAFPAQYAPGAYAQQQQTSGLTGNTTLDGIAATAAGAALADQYGGSALAGGGGAAIGRIFGGSDAQKSSVIGGLAGAGIDILGQMANGKSFSGEGEEGINYKSTMASGIGSLMNGIVA